MLNSKITLTMKKLVYVIAICLLVAGCDKYDSGPADQGQTGKRLLTGSEIILKQNLDKAAKIVADVIQDEVVMNELTLLSDENREFYSLPFKDLLDESKGVSSSFKNLREGFLNGCSAGESKGGWSELASYLAKNDCYIYCPYPASFYPKGTNSVTVAAHPIDNDVENVGYRFESKKMKEVTVNEEYTDKNIVILIMPKDEGSEDLQESQGKDPSVSKGDPINEVKVGKVRCADYCGGIFEGTLELRITRGNPKINLSTEEITGDFNTVIKVDYPRDYAKAAMKGWTQSCNGGWYVSNTIWDSNWRTAKTIQCALAYEYDQVIETTISATLGYKSDSTNASLTGTVKTTYRGDFLGLAEWDRDWFFATNSNPGPDDEIKDGWTVRKTSAEFKLTTPLRIIY
jgi:hypothetical protein